MERARIAASGTGSLEFFEDVSDDKSSEMNCEVWKDKLSQNLVMSMDSRLQAVFDFKAFPSKYSGLWVHLQLCHFV